MKSSIYLGADGWWHGQVTMGVKDDGSPDRRHRRARTEPEVRRKVRALEALRDKGRAPKAGSKPTVAAWMETYLTDIASLKLKPRSLEDYWSKTRNDVIPRVGQHRLDKLQPEHLEKMYRAMLDAGHAPSHVLKVHRILSRALKIAHRRRIIGVGMGFRQGETLGLRWKYVDLNNELFHPRWQLQRLTWRHGCPDPHACGARLHRFDPCPPDCATHKGYTRGCPKPCFKTCTRHASTCPQRKGGGLVFTRPKTKKSRNPVPIPPLFIPPLREHKARQEEAKAVAGDVWQEHEAVFARPDGQPLDPRADWEEFKELLEEAGISDRRLYDGSRHTAGTILNELRVDLVTIMEILRHTQISQTRRYVKGRSTLSKDAMRRMGDAFMPGPEPSQELPVETRNETTDSRAARARRRRRIR